MRKRIFLLYVISFCAGNIFSQSPDKKSVVIGTMIDRPNALLILNPPNGNQGILLPQLTTAQRISIKPQSPLEEGLIVFDTDDKAFYYWKENAWNKGLDGEYQSIQFNATTNHLTLSSNGGDVDLSTLKEIPVMTGQAGKFLTTNGTTINWSDLNGDVAGNLNTNTVTKIQGIAVSATPPTDQQVLLYSNGIGKWVPTTVPGVSNFTAFKVAQNTNQSVNGTFQLNWDTEIYDDGSNFNSNQFRAPAAGLYHFDVLITVQNMNKDNVMMAILRVGASDMQRSIYTSGSKNNDASAQLSTDVKLNANDIVTVWIEIQGGNPGPGPGGSFMTQGGLIYTQFSGRKIY